MFQFTTTTLINDALDYTTKLPRWVAKDETLQIKRVGTFKKANVTAMYKRAYSAPVLAKAVLDMTTITQASGVFRIAMYIRLSGNQNSYYSNDFVFKGKPLYIEFEKKTGDTAAQLATKVANQIKKYQRAYDFKHFNVSVSGNNLIIEAVDEYQRFTKMDIEYFDPDLREIACTCAEGAFAVIASAKEAGAEGFDSKNILTQGREGFGTYQNIIKDLRIPTLDVRRYEAPLQDEVPIINGKYSQYTIYYKVDRGLMGGAAVGQQVVSQTTHVFYVHDSVAAGFEAALATLGTVTEEKKPIVITGGVTDITDMAKAGTKEELTPTIDGGSTVAYVSATTTADWLTVTPGTTKVGFTGTSNDSGAARSAKATVTVSAKNGVSASKEITITQLNA